MNNYLIWVCLEKQLIAAATPYLSDLLPFCLYNVYLVTNIQYSSLSLSVS